MPNDAREVHAENAPVLLSWGFPSVDVQEGALETAAYWLTGGVALALWTLLAVLLTSA